MSGKKGTQRPRALRWPGSDAHHRQKTENQSPVSETDLADAPISEQRERAQQVNTESDDKLATWDPMKDAFESPVFNSYEKKTVLDMSQDPR
jgi:hypothetical protein